MSLRTPLGRVLGRGSAKAGTEHWWSQRLTAVALILLGVWFLLSLLRLPDFSYDAAHDWLASPLNSVLMILLTSTLAWHSSLGVQVVIDDYVHRPFTRVALLILVKFVHVLLAAGALVAVLTVAFGQAA